MKSKTIWSTSTRLLAGHGVTTQGRRPTTKAGRRSINRIAAGDVVRIGTREAA